VGRRQARFTFPVADAGCNHFSKENPMKKEEAKKLADQALSELEQALKAGQSEALMRYLDTMSRFHNYSFCNCMLIALQQPDATFVAGFRRWLQLGRHVRKGEKGIGIIAPLVYRNREDRQECDAEERTIRVPRLADTFPNPNPESNHVQTTRSHDSIRTDQSQHLAEPDSQRRPPLGHHRATLQERRYLGRVLAIRPRRLAACVKAQRFGPHLDLRTITRSHSRSRPA
jgi:hypothetical protein